MTPPLSERLRAANQDLWDSMQTHRFVGDVEADTLPAEVFRRYLGYEQGFVETAILIFGHALLKAPDFAARRWLCGVLHGLGGPQLSYFDRAFTALGEPPECTPEAVATFSQGMLRIAESGDYLDIITVMLAAEWMYAVWCGRAHRQPSQVPLLAEWVRLHAEPEFMQQAEWLKAQIDGAGPQLDTAKCQRLTDLFGQALRLEHGFHSAPYA